MNEIRQKWLDALGRPEYEILSEPPKLLATYDEPEFTGELYLQATSVGRPQRVLMAFPKNVSFPCPAVAVPFYIAEQMMGYNPGTGEVYDPYQKTPIMLHLLRRGYAVASADAYHITYYDSDRSLTDFTRWSEVAVELRRDHPHWSGVGKLVTDTKLMLDLLAADPRVDENRMGIAGFSLGGKMAFYTGCLDERIKAILAIDFGIGWDQTNWRDPWYWGHQVEELMAAGMDHIQLLGSAAPKPLCLLGGEFDTEESWEMLKRTPGYEIGGGRLKYLRYGTDHFPTKDALDVGYDFLDKWLK